MPRYPTTFNGRLPSKIHRYLVTYEEDCLDGWITTFGVDAHCASEATAKTIEYIEDKNLHHDKDHGYTLIPRVSKDKADYNIPYKSNPDI